MKSFILSLILLLSGAALAADGDHVNGSDVTKGSYNSQTFLLCDITTGASCSEFDLNQSGAGMPDFITFSRDATTGCSGNPAIGIDGQTTTGGTEHLITTLNDTTTSATVQFPTFRFIDADVSGNAACTTLQVNMTLYFRKW